MILSQFINAYDQIPGLFLGDAGEQIV